MSLGTKLKEARTRIGMGQAELAAAVGVSVPTISEWESGKKTPSARRWEVISKTLSVDKKELFRDHLLDFESKVPHEKEVFRTFFKNNLNDSTDRLVTCFRMKDIAYRILRDALNNASILADPPVLAALVDNAKTISEAGDLIFEMLIEPEDGDGPDKLTASAKT